MAESTTTTKLLWFFYFLIAAVSIAAAVWVQFFPASLAVLSFSAATAFTSLSASFLLGGPLFLLTVVGVASLHTLIVQGLQYRAKRLAAGKSASGTAGKAALSSQSEIKLAQGLGVLLALAALGFAGYSAWILAGTLSLSALLFAGPALVTVLALLWLAYLYASWPESVSIVPSQKFKKGTEKDKVDGVELVVNPSERLDATLQSDPKPNPEAGKTAANTETDKKDKEPEPKKEQGKSSEESKALDDLGEGPKEEGAPELSESPLHVDLDNLSPPVSPLPSLSSFSNATPLSSPASPVINPEPRSLSLDLLDLSATQIVSPAVTPVPDGSSEPNSGRESVLEVDVRSEDGDQSRASPSGSPKSFSPKPVEQRPHHEDPAQSSSSSFQYVFIHDKHPNGGKRLKKSSSVQSVSGLGSPPSVSSLGASSLGHLDELDAKQPELPASTPEGRQKKIVSRSRSGGASSKAGDPQLSKSSQGDRSLSDGAASSSELPVSSLLPLPRRPEPPAQLGKLVSPRPQISRPSSSHAQMRRRLGISGSPELSGSSPGKADALSVTRRRRRSLDSPRFRPFSGYECQRHAPRSSSAGPKKTSLRRKR